MKRMELIMQDLALLKSIQFDHKNEEEELMHKLEETYMVKKNSLDIESLFTALKNATNRDDNLIRLFN